MEPHNLNSGVANEVIKKRNFVPKKGHFVAWKTHKFPVYHHRPSEDLCCLFELNLFVLH